MIGYNVEQIKELANTLADNYKNIGEKMAEGWSSLSSKMESEWIGPDEVSYEAELAKNICLIYTNCKETVQGMLDNIKIIGDNWINFQKSNLLDGASIQSGFNLSIELPALKTYDIETVVKAGNPSFENATNMGLKNGETSYSNIKTEFDSYIDGVYTSIKGLYENLDTSKAFLGTELSAKVSSYLATIGTDLAKLATCHKSLYENLDKLMARYKTKESEYANDVDTQTKAFDGFNGQNLK